MGGSSIIGLNCDQAKIKRLAALLSCGIDEWPF